MGVGVYEKPSREDKTPAAALVQAKSNAGVKGELRGKAYSEQVQMLTPTEVPPSAPTTSGEEHAAPGGEQSAQSVATAPVGGAAGDAQQAGADDAPSEADQLRQAVANKAEAGSGKRVMSEAETKKIKEGYTDKQGKYHPPMANFTTCIEFARGTMSDANAELYKGDAKKAQATTQAMSDTKVAWETAQGERVKARRFEGFAATYQATVDKYTGMAADARQRAEEMRTRGDGESDAVYKQRAAQAAGKDQAARAYDSVAKQHQKLVDENTKKAAAAMAKADELDKSNKAMIKAKAPLSGRPKAGEYIILEQGQDEEYGKEGSKELLAKGSFKHIAVFMGFVKEDAEYETWKVTEGGGELAATNEIRVKKDDLMIVSKYTSASDLGTSKGSRLGGWIDAGELIKMRDRKGGK